MTAQEYNVIQGIKNIEESLKSIVNDGKARETRITELEKKDITILSRLGIYQVIVPLFSSIITGLVSYIIFT